MSLGSDREPQPEHYSSDSKSSIQQNADNGVWITKDGRSIPIKDLSESHKRNIEKMFKTKLKTKG